jgi:hypothetical protein
MLFLMLLVTTESLNVDLKDVELSPWSNRDVHNSRFVAITASSPQTTKLSKWSTDGTDARNPLDWDSSQHEYTLCIPSVALASSTSIAEVPPTFVWYEAR